MSDPFAPRLGGVLSADIAVPAHEQTVAFYSHMLTTGEQPLWRDDLSNNLGHPIIGLGPQSADYAHLPVQWMPHIQVADVASSCARALELGGSELLHAKADDGGSQWAVLQDPGGAPFGVMPKGEPAERTTPSPKSESVGRIAWLDLTVAYAAATRAFYQAVVGWSVEEVALKDGPDSYVDYCMLGENGEPVAGVCYARGVNAGLPEVWLLYLPVGDLTESLRRAREGGGTVIKESLDSSGNGAQAVVQDPVGASVVLVQS